MLAVGDQTAPLRGAGSAADAGADLEQLGEEGQVEGAAQEVDARTSRRCRSCGRSCAARPAGAGTATPGTGPRCRRAPRRSRRCPSGPAGRRRPRRRRRPARRRAGRAATSRGPGGGRVRRSPARARWARNSSYRLGCPSSSASSARAGGSWRKTSTMSALLLPSRNSTSRYCADWKPELVARNGRISAYSLGVIVASTDHWSVSTRRMCLTRAIRFSAGGRSSVRSRSRAERSSCTSSLSQSSEVWCWTMKSSSSCCGGSALRLLGRRAGGRGGGSRRTTSAG